MDIRWKKLVYSPHCVDISFWLNNQHVALIQKGQQTGQQVNKQVSKSTNKNISRCSIFIHFPGCMHQLVLIPILPCLRLLIGSIFAIFKKHFFSDSRHADVITLELKNRFDLKVQVTVWKGPEQTCFEASHTLKVDQV